MTKAPAATGLEAAETLAPLRRLLTLDRSLTPSDRRVLERLLLAPHPSSAGALARATGTNAQSLYVALDRLEQRGLVIRERNGGGMEFRAGHPSAVLGELLSEARERADLGRRLEAPLRALHESPPPVGEGGTRSTASSTGSLTAIFGAVLHQMRSVQSEVWVRGRESPWCTVSENFVRELVRLTRAEHPIEVRVLVDGEPADSERRAVWDRLTAEGLAIRFASSFRTPMLVLDRRWIFTEERTPGSPESPRYLRLEAPDLAADIARATADEWRRSPPYRPGEVAAPRALAPAPSTRTVRARGG